MTEAEILEWLKPVEDPELFVSVVGLGLVYGAIYNSDDQSVAVKMTLTSPACPMGDQIIQSLKDRLLENENIKNVDVTVVWEPKWDPKEMAAEDIKEELGIW